MAIRIITIAEPGRTVVKIDGRLQPTDMPELVRVLGELPGPAVLDLTELRSVDREAVGPFRNMIDLGLELRAASPYVELLLHSGRNR